MSEQFSRPESLCFKDAVANLATYIAQAQPSVRRDYFTRYENGRKIVNDLEKEQTVFLARTIREVKQGRLQFVEVFFAATFEVAGFLEDEDLPLIFPEALKIIKNKITDDESILFYKLEE